MPWLRFSRFEVPRRRTIGAALRERPALTHKGSHARVYSSTTVHSTSRTCKLAHSRLEYNWHNLDPAVPQRRSFDFRHVVL